MSHGRGTGRGGRGGGRGGAATLPPMGLSFADIQNLSRDPTQLYPPRHLPVSTDLAKDEQSVVQLQLSFSQRLRNSPYYVVERTQNNELPRYSDKYRPSQGARATLRRRDLNPDFFPTEVLNDYFNPPRKRKSEAKSGLSKRAINLDEFNDEDNDQDKSDNDRGSQVSDEQVEDYDVDEEYDNDYAENYFDNGENDDFDNLGDGGGGDEGGGGIDYD